MYCSRCGTWVPADEAACARCGMAMPPATPAALADMREAPAGIAVTAPRADAARYGGFWRRFASSSVDGLLLFFPNAILRALAGLPPPWSLRTLQDDQLSRSLAVTITLTLLGWWYCARLESSRWQGTLGQQLLGMRVCDVHGRRISFARATGRFFAQWLSVLLCGSGYFFNLWTTRRQTLHDMIAGCVFLRPQASAVPAPGPQGPSFAEQTP